MWLARIARPDAIYDASEAAQNFANCKPDVSKEEISENEIQEEEPINVDVPKPKDFEHMPGFKDFLLESPKEANKVNLFKKPRKADTSKTHFTVSNLLFLKKAIRKLKGEGKYQIRFPSVDWAEEDLEIEVHCDAGQILTKTGSRAQIGICGFIRTKITEQNKNQPFRKGISISWPSSKSPRVATSSYAGEIQALFMASTQLDF